MEAIEEVARAARDGKAASNREQWVNRAPGSEAQCEHEDDEPDHDRDHPPGREIAVADSDAWVLQVLQGEGADEMASRVERQPADGGLRRDIGGDTEGYGEQ